MAAAEKAGIEILHLFHLPGRRDADQLCKVNGKRMRACKTVIADGMVIETETQDLVQLRAGSPWGGDQEVQINSMCTVFAESEVISMKNRGIPRERIARAVHSSVFSRLVAMLSRTGYGETVAFSGGVANNPCIVAMLEAQLGDTRVLVPDFPDITGALGAALDAAG